MGTLFLLPSVLISLTCISYIYTAEIANGYDFKILRRVTTNRHDFDLLIFTQQWPATACKEWKKKDHSHSCSMPPKVDSWSIHGIWPTKLGEMGPSFCNRTWLFDPEQIRPIEDQLESVWVNIFAGTSLYSLWSHEWTKHGTCAAVLDKFNSEFKYFSMGLEWLQQYSMSNILQSNNIVPSNTQQYAIEDINKAVKEKLGVDPVIECKKEDGENYISEIRICFTKDLKITNCDGVLFPVVYSNIDGESILTNCDKSMKVTYPHYVSTSWTVHLHSLLSWLRWLTL
ncbi:ribonuclease Oy [Bicyclus anynana]|uniref:Ribonuclease Oy n=1 Tax=Bicyclus anynana TaxID=110368 RepID=A0A6J1PBX6_BICAN|nr:ribonuclease Oy [Bicyclus anynana]